MDANDNTNVTIDSDGNIKVNGNKVGGNGKGNGKGRGNIGSTRPTTSGSPPRKRSFLPALWWTLGLLALFILVIPTILSDLLTDWMWFDSKALGAVYTTRLWLGVGVFFGAGIFATLFCWINWSIAFRSSVPDILYSGQREPVSRGLVRGIMISAAIVVGIILGLAAAEEWPTILLYINGVPFGQADPIFNNDISFYVFTLPFYALLRGWILGLLVITAIGVAALYFLTSGLSQVTQQFGTLGPRTPGQRTSPTTSNFHFNLDRRIGVHLSLLGAAFLFLLSVGYWLGRYDLLYSSRAVAYGAGYTDINAKLPAQYILAVVAAAAAILLIANLWVRTWKLLIGALGVWLVAAIVVGGIYPAFVQQFVVKPSELDKEMPYIQNNIAATRLAFGLDKFRQREVPAVTTVTRAELEANSATVNDIRLWDYRPLRDTFAQLQEIRTYYSFGDVQNVDIDRYQLGDTYRQVMLSARELNSGELNDQARTWLNQHLVYTHGYGAVVAAVNDVVGEGLPNLLLKNVPPETEYPAFKLTRPEIYYGEQTADYVFVDSGAQEFDYPQGDQPKYVTSYEGSGGVTLSNFLTKLLFAVRFGDGNILLSEYIKPDTRILFHRDIHDAIPLLAPFLQYDADPYLVISDGKLYWIQDGYTTTDRYPYSTPYNGINYIRNSVKVVVDAFDGTTNFYVTDNNDPIIRAYRGIFPALFKDMSTAPAGLRAHIRYPEQLMNIQAQMFGVYHMTDPRTFYNREDVWTVPFGTQSENSQPLQAYYTLMRLPGESDVSFRLILPFTPATKDNMIAWMAGNSDGDNYGTVDVIRYPKQQLVYGPRQIEARINQDPNISSQVTLWNQEGSRSFTGNLLTIPISDSVLYVEPLFLQATTSKFPELRRVIVATGDRVGMGVDLKSALDVALGVAPPPPVTGGTGGGATGTPVPGTTPVTRTAADLTQSAINHYNAAQDALKRSDWTTYGQEIEAMKSDLDQLALLTGVPTPTLPIPTPTSSP